MSYLHPKTGLIDPIKEAEILKIMKRTGEEEYYDKMKQAMLDRMRERQPGVPPEIWDRVAKDLDVDTLLQRERAIYDHYYTLDQLKALNAFYDTPAGQHLIDITPALTADTRVVMREWEQQASVKVMLELQDAKLVMPSVPATNSAPPAPSAPTPATNSAPVPPSAPIQSAPMQPAPASHTS